MKNFKPGDLMTKNRIRISLSILAIAISILFVGQATVRLKALAFDNPGSRRLLKTEKSSVFYYRSLPEKSMYINATGMQAVEIRAIAKTKVDKPQLIVKVNGKKTVYDLKFLSASVEYQIYEPIRLSLAPGTKQVELISYNRNIYYRAFNIVTIPPKVKTPALKILSRNVEYILASQSHKEKYYGVKVTAPLSFQVNKNKAFSLYVRAQLTEKQVPVFDLYKDGKLIDKVTLSLKRTKSYNIVGIEHLTIGKKLDFPAQTSIAKYELRPVTDHLFIARPVIKLQK
jgi:hypothetical protein